MNKKLILVGGGGHCKAVIDVAESAGYTVQGILDTPDKVGTTVLGYPVVGVDDDIPKYVPEAEFLVTVGHIQNAALRMKLHQLIAEAGGTLATVVARTAYVSTHALIGRGTVVMHHALVNAGAEVGEGCIINTFANVEHDVVIGNYCHISTGAMVNGTCRVGSGTFVGSQSVLANDVSVAENCVVGAGSFVRKSLKIPGVYSGNPAILKIKR